MKKLFATLIGVAAVGAPLAAQDVITVISTGAGVFTETPAAEFHVKDPSPGGTTALIQDGALQVSRLDGSNANIRFSATGTNWLFANNPNNPSFEIRNETDGRTPFFIFKSATAGLLRLENDQVRVNGKVVVNGSQVHPDFVFEKDYNLMEIGELKAFVHENKHLPGVQSASDVEAAGGFDLSGLSLDLLLKVEELTLYTIQQEETISALSARIERLEASN